MFVISLILKIFRFFKERFQTSKCGHYADTYIKTCQCKSPSAVKRIEIGLTLIKTKENKVQHYKQGATNFHTEL